MKLLTIFIINHHISLDFHDVTLILRSRRYFNLKYVSAIDEISVNEFLNINGILKLSLYR